MDCMASNAATKNGLVLSSLPAASGMLVLSPRATTECEFDLASKPDRRTGSSLRSPTKGALPTAYARPQQPDGVLDQVKAKPLRGGPAGPALTCSARAILTSLRSGRRGGRSQTKRCLSPCHNTSSCEQSRLPPRTH